MSGIRLGWLELFGAAMSVVAIALFVVGYRARTLERLRRVEGWARGCFGLTLLSSLLSIAGVALMFAEAMSSMTAGSGGIAFGGLEEVTVTVMGPLPLPLAAWLGLVTVRRRRAALS